MKKEFNDLRCHPAESVFVIVPTYETVPDRCFGHLLVVRVKMVYAINHIVLYFSTNSGMPVCTPLEALGAIGDLEPTNTWRLRLT